MCDDLGIDNTNIQTYRLTAHSGSDLIDTSLENLLETLKVEFENITDDDYPLEYSIVVEKKYTQKELDEMGEWDGF